MKKKIGYMLGIAGILAAGSAFATGTWSAWTQLATVEVDGGDLGTTNQPGVFLTFQTTPSNKPTCSGSNLPAWIQGSPDQGKAMTSLVTAALLAGRQVKVWFDGTCSPSIGGTTYPAVKDIMVQ